MTLIKDNPIIINIQAIDIQAIDIDANDKDSIDNNNTNNSQNNMSSTSACDEPNNNNNNMIKTPVHTTYNTFSQPSSVAYSARTKTLYMIAPLDLDLSQHLTLLGNTIQERRPRRSSLYYMFSWASFTTVSLGPSPKNSNSRDLDGWSKEEEVNGDDENNNNNHSCRCCCLFS